MNSYDGPSGLYPIFCAGIDWVTCTAPQGWRSGPLEEWARGFMREQKSAGRDVVSASRLGYVGHSTEHCFVGQSAQGLMCQLSGPCAAYAGKEVIALACNVSRLDLQVTVWTGEAKPHIGKYLFEQLKTLENTGGRPAAFALTQSEPAGETLTLNKRVSDTYTRIYDFSSAHKIGQPRQLWRFEVELKRKVAMRWARIVNENERTGTVATDCVRAVTTAKGLDLKLPMTPNRKISEQALTTETDCVLAWYESSVSKSIQRSIKRYGFRVTIEALGLSRYLVDERSAHGSLPCANSTLEAGVSPITSQPRSAERLPLY